MGSSALTLIADYHIGDIASIAGVLISLIGFGVTVVNVGRSRRAAERAQKAAENATETIRMFEAVVDITTVIGMLEEVKRSHRGNQWSLLPDRYATLRKTLIGVRQSRDLSGDHAAVLQQAIVNLSDMEKAVEKELPDVSTKLGIRFNRRLSENIDALAGVLAELKFADTGA